MKFLIISHVVHTEYQDKVYGYGPYIKEMNLWLKYVDEVRIVAPINAGKPDTIDLAYNHSKIIFNKVPTFNLLTMQAKLKTLCSLPFIFTKIILAMAWADHIHLRCPGNMGLLGSIAQILFPWKIKTVKYAGNWDPKSPQPRSYRVQKSIISNTTISKNMKVLAYGQWPNQSSNIVNFFTATYSEKEKDETLPRSLDGKINIVFIGALSIGKQPLIAVETVHELSKQGKNVYLDIMGEGAEREKLESYIKANALEEYVVLHGNQNSEFVKNKLKQAHFLILMSKSEGWPKVVAEAMFWGVVPITSNVSCVNYMIGDGSRGTLVEKNSDAVVEAIKLYLADKDSYHRSSLDAMQWSKQFTLESFELAIKGILDVK